MQISTALIYTFIGAVGVISAFALHKIMPRNRVADAAMTATQQGSAIYNILGEEIPPAYAFTTPASVSSLPPYTPTAQ